MISTIVGDITITQAEEFANRISIDDELWTGLTIGDFSTIFDTELGIVVMGLDDMAEDLIKGLEMFNVEISIKQWGAQVGVIYEAICSRLYMEWGEGL